MKIISFIIISCLLLGVTNLYSQAVKFESNKLEPVDALISTEQLTSTGVVKVIKDSTVKESDQPTFVKIKGIDFKTGTIEVKILSRLLKNAPDFARGFIGVAFHINDSNSRFECIYLRPTNGRADDQLRRNHSIQYFSFPDYSFERLRKEAPGEYESYADMGLDEWITMKIQVKEKQAKLYLNGNKQPSLIVNDLKLGDNVSGTVGLWVDVGTEGFFKELKVIND